MKKYKIIIEDTHGFRWKDGEGAEHLTKEQVEVIANKYAGLLCDGALFMWVEDGVRIFPAHTVHAVRIEEVDPDA